MSEDAVGPGRGAGPAGPAEEIVYGLLELGGVDVALPLQVLREVVPYPGRLSGLPVRVPGLLGGMVVRETVLPVLELPVSAGAPEQEGAHRVVVVLAHGGRLVGLLADRVRGVIRVPTGQLSAVSAPGTTLLFSHTFHDEAAGRVVSVLDAEAVLSLPGLPAVADTGRSGVQLLAGRGGGERGRTHAVMRCGDLLLALDVRHVHTTLPGRTPTPTVLSGDLCLGSVDFDGRPVAVVDPVALLGLGRLGPGTPGAGLVLDLGVGHVVLALGALLDLQDLSTAETLAIPRVAVRRPELLAGMTGSAQAGACLVLDGEALLRDADLLALAGAYPKEEAGGPQDPAPPGERDGGDAAGPAVDAATGLGRPYLLYRAGERATTPLDQVAEIVPVPGGLVRAQVSEVLLGVTAHRGRALPVVALAALLGLPADTTAAGSCLLVVGGAGPEGDGAVGFVVDLLESIQPLAWTDPAAGGAGPGGPADLAGAPLVCLGEDGALVPELDLRAVATWFLAGAGADGAEADGAQEPGEGTDGPWSDHAGSGGRLPAQREAADDGATVHPAV